MNRALTPDTSPAIQAFTDRIAAQLPEGQTMEGVRSGWTPEGSWVMTWPCPDCGVHDGHSAVCRLAVIV